MNINSSSATSHRAPIPMRAYRLIAAVLFLAPALLAAVPAAGETPVPVWHEISGARTEYEVEPRDTVDSIAARFGEPELTISKDDDDPIPGSVVEVDNRHNVPTIGDGVVVNIPQRMVFLMRDGRLVGAWPATVGRPDWQTPLGSFYIEALTKNPTWHVPPAIRAEMEDEGISIGDEVKPGSANPLGKLWMGLDHGGIGIHGTNHPKSIFHYGSHGCIRLAPESAAALFGSVGRSEPVEIIYQPVSLAVLGDGRIFLESDSDPYERGHADIGNVREAARKAGVEDAIDWARASRTLVTVEGIARRIDRGAKLEGPSDPS
jgi:L,D-transpeptidase ErfK/SrfK